jgi:hypothetical protein
VAKSKPSDKLRRFIRSTKATKVDPGPLQSSSSNLASGANSGVPPPRPKTAIFGLSLQEVMEKQKDKYPDAELPRVLDVLVDAVFKMDGTRTEGIFRYYIISL